MLPTVLYRNPDRDTEMPSLVLPATYLCRYSLRIDDDSRVVILPYTGDSDDWTEMTVAALNSKKRKVDDDDDENDDAANRNDTSGAPLLHHLLTPPSAKRGSSDNTTGILTTSAQKRRRVGDFATEEGIDDGITMQIQVGPDHQVKVPKFVANQYNMSNIVSRKPVRMWKPDKISQEGTDDYIEQAAHILTPYLRQHHLTQEEPYAPFPTQRMEELSRSLSRQRLPTLSSVSTVSSLTTHKVDALREFNIDALLRNLHVSNYNVRAAIAAIEASPMDYLVAWSSHEKARFNTGFRRYSGSLRAIYKGMGSKSLSDVIDYHYRFKIPDQFRKIQERKREQAIRMLEVIETKRNLNAPIVVSTGIPGERPSLSRGAFDEGDKGDWTKTGSSSLAVSLEERRVKAKELLLDVEAKFGRNKMMKVFEVFKHADETSIPECKNKLLEIFTGHRDFQSRFLEFMPQQLRL